MTIINLFKPGGFSALDWLFMKNERPGFPKQTKGEIHTECKYTCTCIYVYNSMYIYIYKYIEIHNYIHVLQ